MKTNIRPFTLCVASLFVLNNPNVSTASSTIRISQVYGGGGNSGAIYQNDFVELFNASASPVNITGWTIQYAAATSALWHATNLSGIINAGSYYLIQLDSGGAVGLKLPTPDAIGSTNMSATDGKVALVNNSAVLSSACAADISIIDLVGYGTTADCYEGAGAAPAASNTESVLRDSNGCLDTDNNASDFAKGTPAPRNSFSAQNLCATTGIGVLPEDSAIKIRTSRNKLYVDFSNVKIVNATIEVVNLQGQSICSEAVNGNEVYTKELINCASGYIIVKVINLGEETSRKLVVISH